MRKSFIKFFQRSERGQSMVLIALVFIGLLAFIGLTVDMGILFVSYGNLRRAVDNAALAAATQMRENYTNLQLKDSAAQFLHLNNVMVDPVSVNVQTCDTTPGDPQLCPTGTASRRKLVRVTASAPVEFSFLPVIGMNSTTITANAIAEAASMDVVLVIDISESMANESSPAEMKDPTNCNADDPGGADGVPGECHPFEEVKSAAASIFANYILNKTAAEEEDRLAIVTFSNGWEAGYSPDNKIPTKGTGVVCPDGIRKADGNCQNPPWTNDYTTAYNLITALKVYERPVCTSPWQQEEIPGSCSEYGTPGVPATYIAARCPYAQDDNLTTGTMGPPTVPNVRDASTCQTTNIGGGLKVGASLYGIDMRKDALWLMILLTDGAANATEVSHDSDPEYLSGGNSVLQSISISLPIGFCPLGVNINGGCRDNSVSTRHDHTNAAQYDADDYARDMADLVSCDATSPAAGCDRAGQGAIMFAIGLGDTVVNAPLDGGGTPYGDSLLRYIGAVGDDGDPGTDPCSGVSLNAAGYSCGNYYFSASGAGLNSVFQQIASRVFTRLAK